MYLTKLLSIFLISFSVCVNALYEDQVGKFDWKMRYIGEVVHSKIELEGKTPRIYVATGQNVVASINPKNGKIIWRNLLESGNDGIIRALHVANEVVTVSGSGPFIVRGWNKSSGLQIYEWSTPLTVPKEGIWTLDQQKVYQVRLNSNSAELTGFHTKSGNPAGSTKTISSPWISSPSKCTVSNGMIGCLSTEGKGITTMNLGDLSVKSGVVSIGANHVGVSSVGNGILIESKSGTSKVAIFDVSGTLVTIDVPSKAATSVHKVNNGFSILVAVSHSPENSNLDVEYTIVETKKKTGHSISHKFPLAKPVRVSAYCNLGADGDPNCLTLISMEDQSACLLQKNKMLWIREEALANVINVEMVDLPVSDEEAAFENELANKGVDSSLTSGVVGMLSRRISSQVIHLHNLVSHILGLIDSSKRATFSHQLVKDAFGLHKLIILSTKVSKIFAIDNENGEIIWQTYLSSVVPLKSIGEDVSPIYVLRSARHIPHTTVATILFKDRKTSQSMLYVFDPITGSTADGGFMQFGKKILQCMLLPEPNDEFINGLLLLAEDGEVIVYPSSAKQVALAMTKSLFMFTLDSNTGKMTGYNFLKSPDQTNVLSNSVWSLQLPEKLVGVVGKRRDERVHSQGRVLGDRSVLYKYVNPNLIAVATLSPDPNHKSIVNVYLIDAVSGILVFSVSHKRATEPVHLVHSENWIVYSYFSEKTRRTEIITLDLYEGKLQRNTTAFSSLDTPLEPLIERQAYIFPHSIVTMKETITDKGITSKHVLLGLSTGSVMEMPWALLDPRRSITATPEMREEGIVPYVPELGLPHEAAITYNHTLESIRGIHTSPSRLESTCLVFVYGLDLFYTRVTPSKTFDVLKEDFEYWLITAVLSALVIAAYVTKRLASRKALMLAWK